MSGPHPGHLKNKQTNMKLAHDFEEQASGPFLRGSSCVPGTFLHTRFRGTESEGRAGRETGNLKGKEGSRKGGGRFRLESHVSLPRLMANRPSLRDSCSFKNEITGLRIAEAGEQISQTNQR